MFIIIEESHNVIIFKGIVTIFSIFFKILFKNQNIIHNIKNVVIML